jgi:DNA-binding transcriptional LysR family regulator
MNGDELLVFETVARAGSITRAAQKLNTVQSNVTARIQLLERELGVPLFHRNSRGVILTRAGQELLPYAIKIGLLLNEAKHAVGDEIVPRGPLRIGALETITALRLPSVLVAYTQAYPEVDLFLHTCTTDELIADLLEYRLEGALVAGPVNHPALIETRVCREEMVIVSAPIYRDLSTLLSIPGVKIVVFRTGCSYRRRLERLLEGYGVDASRRLELGTLEGIIGCVAAGVGITFLPRAIVQPAQGDGVVALHQVPADEALVNTVFVRRRDTLVSSALAKFIECAVQHSDPSATNPHEACYQQ